jgi:hypothetical protein
MYCPEGYVLLSEIHRTFLWQADDVVGHCTAGRPEHEDRLSLDDGVLSEAEFAGFSTWVMRRFFVHFEDRVRACLPSGHLVRLRHGTFQVGFPTDESEADDLLNLDEAFPDTYDLRVRLGDYTFPFVDLKAGTLTDRCKSHGAHVLTGCPLCIAETELKPAVERLAAWLVAQPAPRFDEGDSRPGRHDGLAESIVDAARSGRVKNKAEAQALFGKGMKTEAWLAVWRSAVRLHPALSRSGRRPAAGPA